MAKILVADDNSNIQKMVGLALKDQGIDVVAVGNGEAAVRKISDVRPDLVLADVFMPVRNGYEVCRYVKEDTSLSHIPVILLVGAFDPLDEQEAQRVGADGVLKKPFVPPDPLISMVKSALVRAGVPLGPAAPEEKASPPPRFPAADILSGGLSSKLAALSTERIPQVSPEPVEEFPTPAPNLKIAAGSGPLAFGNLLDAPDAEDLAVTAKPMIDLSEERKWNEESDGVEEEKEEAEESPRGGWRPGALDEHAENSAGASHTESDWREQAFHGASPAKTFSSNDWVPPAEHGDFAEAAEAQSVAVATISSKPAESPVPFSGDAWAAAMAAGVEERIEGTSGEAPGQTAAVAQESIPEALCSAAPVEETRPVESAEPANWATVPETAWELEAKKASLLASTWDIPKVLSADETQDITTFAKEAIIEQIEAPTEASNESSAYSAEPVISSSSDHPEHEQAPPSDPAASDHIGSGAGAAAIEPTESALEAALSQPEAPVVVSPPQAPVDVDDVVARVLGKLDPEMLEKVTREILKPMIEAIVRDEINSKKS